MAARTPPAPRRSRLPRPPSPSPRIPSTITATLLSSPRAVASGSQVTLTWGSTNATSCTAGGPWTNSGTLAGNGLTDPLTANTTFTFQCSGNGQTSPLQSVTVSVGAAPVNGVCASTHSSCTAGTSVNPVDGTSAWTWTCQGTNGGTNAACTETKPAPTATLSASPLSVASGAQVTLTWSSTHATSCTAGGPWTNSGTLSGNGLTDPLTANTTFTFQCSGNGQTSA